jgi:predicted hotdog family 3-hydroxylacyl-ACP dehydratase
VNGWSKNILNNGLTIMTSGKNPEPLATGHALLQLIPQKPPMVLIDTLWSVDDTTTRTSFVVTEQCQLCSDGVLTESGLIENIAQTASAGVGYGCKRDSKAIPLGFIAAIRHCSIFHLPEVGTRITTEVMVTNQILDVTIIKGLVMFGEILCAECEMRIFIQPEGSPVPQGNSPM